MAHDPSVDTKSILEAPISRRSFIVGTTLASASWYLAACSPAASTSPSSAGTGVAPSLPPTGSSAPSSSAGTTGAQTGEITLAFNIPIVTLDNKAGQVDAQVTTVRAVREGLTEIGQDSSSVKPLLAKSFEKTAPNEWKVTLRAAKFANGDPVTVEDVQKSIESYKATKVSFVGQTFVEWPTLTKIDESTFTLTTVSPSPQLDRQFSNILILPASIQHADDVVDAAPGSGAFQVDSWQPGSGILKLVPNPNYVGPTPAKLSVVHTRVIIDDATRYAAMQAGEVDVIDSVTPQGAAVLEKNRNITIIRSEGTRLAHLFYNFRKPKDHPLANVKVREALTYAIDGELIIKDILLNSASPLKGPIPSTLFPSAAVGSFKYDPAKAKSMLAEAGVTGFPALIIWGQGEFFNVAQVMEAVAAMLKEVGIDAKLLEFGQGGGNDLTKYRNGEKDWDFLGNGWGNQTGNAAEDMVGMFGPSAERVAANNTYCGYVYPEISAMINSAITESDPSKSQDMMTGAQQAVWDTWPALWGFTQNNVVAHSKKVTGINLKPINSYNLAEVSVT